MLRKNHYIKEWFDCSDLLDSAIDACVLMANSHNKFGAEKKAMARAAFVEADRSLLEISFTFFKEHTEPCCIDLSNMSPSITAIAEATINIIQTYAKAKTGGREVSEPDIDSCSALAREALSSITVILEEEIIDMRFLNRILFNISRLNFGQNEDEDFDDYEFAGADECLFHARMLMPDVYRSLCDTKLDGSFIVTSRLPVDTERKVRALVDFMEAWMVDEIFYRSVSYQIISDRIDAVKKLL